MLTTRHLRLGYEGRPLAAPDRAALDLRLEPGQVICLLGPNGSGKSTLLRTLAGLLHPISGGVFWEGKDLLRLSRREQARALAYVPQTTPEVSLPVYDVVLTGRTPHLRFAPGAEDKAAVESALERMGIADWRDRPLDTLSGGERQKALLARALAQESPALLLDEPLTGLDARHQAETCLLLRELARQEGRLVLMAAHELNLAARYGDQLHILLHGALWASGSPESTLSPRLLAQVYGVRAEILHIHGALQVIVEGPLEDGALLSEPSLFPSSDPALSAASAARGVSVEAGRGVTLARSAASAADLRGASGNSAPLRVPGTSVGDFPPVMWDS